MYEAYIALAHTRVVGSLLPLLIPGASLYTRPTLVVTFITFFLSFCSQPTGDTFTCSLTSRAVCWWVSNATAGHFSAVSESRELASSHGG